MWAYHKEEAPRRTGILQKGPRGINHHNNSTTQERPVNAQGKVIGYLQDHTFIKPVIGSKHRLRRPPAWAIDAEAFDAEVKPNATEIIIMDKETELEYHCTTEAFDRLKRELDRGFGRQYFLVLSRWEVRNKQELGQNKPQQLALAIGGCGV